MLAVYIQYKYTYKKMYITDQTYSPTLQLTYIPEMLAVYIRYQYIYIFILMSGDDRSGRHMLLPSRGEALAELEEPL